MKETKEQLRLIKEIRKTRNKYNDIKLSSIHYGHLLRFFRKYKSYILRLIILIFLSSLVEMFLIILSRDKISSIYSILGSYFWSFFIIFIILFVVSSFFSIKQEKTIMVLFANDIRHKIFKYFIDKSIESIDNQKQANLIAKISYQLSLVSMGVSSVFFGIIRWFIYFFVAIIISYLIGLNLIIISLSFIILSLFIAIIAYYVAKNYVSQEATFYSQIMKHIDINLSEKYFIKNFNNEDFVIEKFDKLVNIDSFFRIRRNLWIGLSSKIVFLLILIFVILSNFFIYEFSSFINLLGTDNRFLFLFLMFYFPRALNQALRVGLYFFPAKLGLFLTVQKRGAILCRKDILKINNYISFFAKKTKLFKESRYFRNFNFKFQTGDRVLIYGDGFSGKTSLAKIFSGIKIYNPRALKVRIDDIRYDYPIWQRRFCDFYFFDLKLNSEKSLIEFILAKDKEQISSEEIEGVVRLISENQFIASKISYISNFNSSCKYIWSNSVSSFALQALHCIANKSKLIIIDNICLDPAYNDIIQILKILNEKLENSIFLVFSRNENDYLIYTQKHELNNEIKKIL